jgi:hypothetical protein
MVVDMDWVRAEVQPWDPLPRHAPEIFLSSSRYICMARVGRRPVLWFAVNELRKVWGMCPQQRAKQPWDTPPGARTAINQRRG